MTVNTYDFVHLALHAMGGSIQGKTKLQKTVYFLGIITGCRDDLGYRPHFYGPYSDEVADAVGQLKALGFVDTTTSAWGIDQRGFEVRRTDYTLNEDGKAIAAIKAEKLADLWKKLQDAVPMLAKAGDLDYMKLSVAAKTYFMLEKKGGGATRQDLVALANRFGWSVTAEQVQQAGDFLQDLGLVSATSN